VHFLRILLGRDEECMPELRRRTGAKAAPTVVWRYFPTFIGDMVRLAVKWHKPLSARLLPWRAKSE